MSHILRRHLKRRGLVLGAALVLAATVAPAASARIIASGLDDPRGIGFAPGGRILVVESLSGEITQLRRQRGFPRSTIATVPGAVDIASRGGGRTYAVIGSPPPSAPPGRPAALLVRIRADGSWHTVADIGAYQKGDPDPHDLEGNPRTSNPNGLALLRDGRILVVDAEGNDLLLVGRNGSVKTVARFPTRTVPWPSGLGEGPPPGTPVPSEAVPTSVTVGPDGAWYVAELRGFPFTPGKSRVWRVDPRAREVECGSSPRCRVYRDGFTSVIDLDFGDDRLYVLEIAKQGLLAVEVFGAPPIGALWAVEDRRKSELARGKLLAPGGIAVGATRHGEVAFITTGTIFGPGKGQVVRLDVGNGDDDNGNGNGNNGD
jgi:hypothetical protein